MLAAMCECVDYFCVTQDRDLRHSYDDLVAIGSMKGNESLWYLSEWSSSQWC